MKPRLIVMGCGLSKEDLTGHHLEVIAKSEILMGGARLLDSFQDYPGKKIVIKGNLKEIKALIRDNMGLKRMVVLASGDPLLFGIGATLVRELGPEQVMIYPNISSMAAAFARLGEPWHDAGIVSLHGRVMDDAAFYDIFAHGEKFGVLTDSLNTPGAIASRLLDAGLDEFEIHVFERLGSAREKHTRCSLGEAAAGVFHQPNIIILKRCLNREAVKREPFLYPGLPEKMFSHGRGLITKSEVRVVSLAKLRLLPGSILWDLGAGSGSISVEASLYIKRGRIFAVEKHRKRVEDIKINKKRFDVNNLTVIHGNLPGGLDGIPDPDRVFIGGGGRELEGIMEMVQNRLKPGGVMVVNTVLWKSMDMAVDLLEKSGFAPEVVQIQVNRGRNMPWSMRFEAENPVWIISGEKKGV